MQLSLEELRRREKEMGIEPDWHVDALMKAETLEGFKTSIVTEVHHQNAGPRHLLGHHGTILTQLIFANTPLGGEGGTAPDQHHGLARERGGTTKEMKCHILVVPVFPIHTCSLRRRLFEFCIIVSMTLQSKHAKSP